LGLALSVKLPATSTMVMVTVALIPAAAALVYVGKVTRTVTVPVVTPLRTLRTLPLSEARAPPDTIE
jgi:hypothetical protein